MASKITRKQLENIVKSYEGLRGGNSIRVWRGYRQEDGKRGWIMQHFGRSEEIFLGQNLTDAYENVIERIDEYTGTHMPPRN